MQLNKIKHRRGLDANLPAGGTEAGELRYSTDLKKLYIDDGVENVLLATHEGATGLATSVVVIPSGTLTSTNAQSALIELDTKKIASTEKGAINGVATLDNAGRVPSSQLPSYVDDVLEYANVASFPVTGEVGKIYVALDVNLTYRWGGSNYVEISPSIALGETSATAYRGDRGASAYAHSTLADGTNPHGTTFANIASRPTTVAGYGITDGVTLTGTQTLTNKTLTTPVLNTEVTGTGVTTTGEASKLIKVNSSGVTVLGGTSAMMSGMTGTPPRLILSSLGYSSGFLNKTYSSIPSAAGMLSLGKSRGGAVGTESTTSNGDALGYYVFEGVGSGNAPAIGASIEGVQNGTAGATYVPADIVFKTCTSTVQSEVLRLKSDKSVQVSSLAGTGTRMVTADSSGNLSAEYKNTDFLPFSDITTTWTNIHYINFSCFLSITFYNLASTSMQGVILITVTPTGMLNVSSTDNTGLGISVQYSAGYIQLKTTSGSVSGSVNRLG